MNKKIAVFFDQPGDMGYPFTFEMYINSYIELGEEIQKQGGELYIVRENSSYLGDGEFSHYWIFGKNNKIKRVDEKVKIDAVYNKYAKTQFKHDGKIKTLNSEWIDEICDDKFKTYELFENISPKTIVVKNEKRWLEAIGQIPGEMIVSKPVSDYGGNGVVIDTKSNIIKQKKEIEYPAIVQEFMDTSCGIDGICEGVHDMRIVFVSGEMIYSYVRLPAEGELRANLQKGGSRLFVKKEDIPESAKKIADRINEGFKKEKNYILGVDIGFTPSGPKLIELNSKVGLPENSANEAVPIFKEKVAQTLINL